MSMAQTASETWFGEQKEAIMILLSLSMLSSDTRSDAQVS